MILTKKYVKKYVKLCNEFVIFYVMVYVKKLFSMATSFLFEKLEYC